MALINPYDEVIATIKPRLEADERFGGRGINIIYDRTEDRQVEINLMPAINYFLEDPWNDTGIGTAGYVMTTRHFTLRLGFGIWMVGRDAGNLDSNLFAVGQDLLDFWHQNQQWDQRWVIDKDIRVDFDYVTIDGTLIGAQRQIVEFDTYLV